MWRAPEILPGRKIRELAPPEHWRKAAREILRREGLAAGDLVPFATGSDVVWGDGRSVVKLSTPRWSDAIAWEERVLHHVHGQLPVATPRCLARGTLDDWPYLVMDHVPGRAIGDVWSRIRHEQRLDLALQIGELTRALHDRTAPPKSDPWAPFWKRCQDQARSRSAESALAEQVPSFLERWPAWPCEPARVPSHRTLGPTYSC